MGLAHPHLTLTLALCCSWDFLGWLLADNRLEFFEKAVVVCISLRLLGLTIAILSGAPIFKLLKGNKVRPAPSLNPWPRLPS